ncbi:MAG: nucleotidyltransferase family protein [Gemmatimonadota bacterium]
MVKLDLSHEAIADFCRRWRVSEFALFGSVLRDDFSPDSDVDVLVTFDADADWSLLDHVQMQDELSVSFGRPVDVITRKGLERSRNSLRRQEILSSARLIYVAS